MKKEILFSIFCSSIFLTGCGLPRKPCVDEVVCQTHLHRYGVPLDPNDWCARGQNGQVISTLKNGIVVAQNYDKGILHGQSTYTFPYRSAIQKREVYEMGNLIELTENYPDGLPLRTFTYLSDNSYTLLSWYHTGAPMARESFEEGLLVTGAYYDLNNNVESSVVEGFGTKTIRNGEGVLLAVQTVKGGFLVSEITYHPNGTPSAVNPYFRGVIEGERKTYSPSGEPCTIESWKAGVQDGVTSEFEFGVRVCTVPYVNGKKQGVEARYAEDGETLAAEFSWFKGKKHGRCYSYFGGVKKEDWYYRDELVNKQTFDALSNQ